MAPQLPWFSLAVGGVAGWIWQSRMQSGSLTVVGVSGATLLLCQWLLRWLAERPFPGGPKVPRQRFSDEELRERADDNEADLAAWRADAPYWKLMDGVDAKGRHVWVFEGGALEVAKAAKAGRGKAAKAGKAVGASFPFDWGINPNASDLLYRAQARKAAGQEPGWETVDKAEGRASSSNSSEAARDAMERGVSFYSTLQHPDGHWPGDYGGPMFLLPGLVIVLYVTGALDAAVGGAPGRRAIIAYLLNHQQPDGGWGTHIEGESTMFGTVLNYIALRLLRGQGEGSAAAATPAKAATATATANGSNGNTNDKKSGSTGRGAGSGCCERVSSLHARAFIHRHGGPGACPSWGKFYMCLLGVYDWRGVNAIPVELWCLPLCIPFHPWRMWCHARMVYLPMSLLYCRKAVAPGARAAGGAAGGAAGAADPLIAALRAELYPAPAQSYETMPWHTTRDTCSHLDLYSPQTRLMRGLHAVLALHEWILRSGKEDGLGSSSSGSSSSGGSSSGGGSSGGGGILGAIVGTVVGGPLRALRRRGLRLAMDYIHAEDEQTHHIDIGPVNKAMNMASCWFEAQDERRRQKQQQQQQQQRAEGAGRRSDSTDSATAVNDPYAMAPATPPRGEAAFAAHVTRVPDYLWVAEDGMKMNGYNGSQLWDCTFALQAIASARGSGSSGSSGSSGLAGPAEAAAVAALRRGHGFVDDMQVLEDEKDYEKWYRHISRGGWPFSTVDHGWPISDCTAEGLKVALELGYGYHPGCAKAGSAAGSAAGAGAGTAAAGAGTAANNDAAAVDAPIEPERLAAAVNVILSFQNADGGWASYENTRGGAWFELLNPAEVFGDIMIDYTYVECTSASVQALVAYLAVFPGTPRRAEIVAAVRAGADFIRRKQQPDGGWYGSWAVCFLYGTWFGVEGLAAAMDMEQALGSPPPAGSSRDEDRLARACRFILERQRQDGGWSESVEACGTKAWVDGLHLPRTPSAAAAAAAAVKTTAGSSSSDGGVNDDKIPSYVVSTAWALLSLVRAGCKDQPVSR